MERLQIDLKSLTEATTTLNFKLGDDFFAAVGGEDVKKGSVELSVVVRNPIERCYELDFSLQGVVIVPCDRCLDDMQQPVENEAHLVAKLGKENAEDGDLVIVDENDGRLDIGWFVYENIVLAIPMKHTHADGECNAEMMRLIDEHTAGDEAAEEQAQAVDPRWSALEKIRNNI